jgi:hypothetical protein
MRELGSDFIHPVMLQTGVIILRAYEPVTDEIVICGSLLPGMICASFETLDDMRVTAEYSDDATFTHLEMDWITQKVIMNTVLWNAQSVTPSQDVASRVLEFLISQGDGFKGQQHVIADALNVRRESACISVNRMKRAGFFRLTPRGLTISGATLERRL